MDLGARIYATALVNVASHLGRINQSLAEATLKDGVKFLEYVGVKYELTGSALTIKDASEKGRRAMYELILYITAPFERQYGVNEVWGTLKVTIVKAVQGFRDEIRELNIEVPIARYRIQYSILDSLFGFNPSDFRVRKWMDNPILITNQRLVFIRPDGEENIPFSAVATVDREIYIGYSSEVARGVIRSIDYQIRPTGISSVILLAKKNTMNDFMKAVSVLRAENMRLTTAESKVLIALYNNTPPSDLANTVGISQEESVKAFKRLQSMAYVDSRGHLTSYGINKSMEIMQVTQR